MAGRPGHGKPERYMQPSILMALLEEPSHGYELIQKISDYGFLKGDAPPGMVYRHLRQMEEEGMVVSRWEAEGGGPAKRIYEITPEGRDVLLTWVSYMETQAKTVLAFVKRYQDLNA